MTTLAELNRIGRDAFVAKLGAVFEHSPWVAEAVADHRPFADLDHLHRAMVAAVTAAPDRQLALLRAHPELAGGAALGAASAAEQASLGLDHLAIEEQQRFVRGNQAYARRFGFPFIIAVKGQRDRRAILESMESRLENDAATEQATALDEVAKIARFRLEAMLESAGRLTIHVLDTGLGIPAAGMGYTLYRLDASERHPITTGKTGADGRATGGNLLPGIYELVFAAGAYREAAAPFFDEIPIRFRITDAAAHYHVPLILAPYGYTTYRGS
jgi:2-oxo-4-hydroxy-4-carboxy-5-ureidoimidazoline decarboxylase